MTAGEPLEARAATDLGVLLLRSLEGLAEASGAGRLAVWGRDASARPRLLAHHEASPSEADALAPPDAESFAAATALPGATDLGARGIAPALATLAGRQGLAAAAPVLAEGEPTLVLLLGGPEDPPGGVRPRTLAALGHAAARLAGPAAGAAAAARLAGLGPEVQQLERLATLGGLVAEIVHEIRNPLVSVKTFLDLLPEHGSDPDFEGEFLDVAGQELRRIERLLDAVLACARPAPSRGRDDAPDAIAGAAIEAACESVTCLLAHRAAQRQVALEVEVSPSLPAVALGPDAIRQVLLNLTLNAIDATPEGRSVRLRARTDGDRVLLEVADEGPGVAAELRSRLFEPFVSTRRERPGGLGLAITRRLVEEGGGRIELADRPGGGAVFRLLLPRAQAAPAESHS